MYSPKMKSMVISFSFLFHLTLIDGGSTTTEVSCGNRLTAPRGVIQTPNFPRSFPVPIKCRWVIDVSDIPATNSSIVVYLTQVYVYKGLSFTEYAYRWPKTCQIRIAAPSSIAPTPAIASCLETIREFLNFSFSFLVLPPWCIGKI